ncbi:MAG: AAA family ATPase [Ktedonobacteraceae bacterium]|nr:AAA family ATPase [Ktedonobacteraceae bacterium]
MPVNMRVPRRTLLVLCGSAGSGKSTFAAQHFGAPPTTIVSSDHCRELICDDPNNQQANLDTFDLFYYIINKRLFNGRFTVADSTALRPDARLRLWEIARRHGYLACLLVFNLPAELCLERDRQRTRQVGPQVIAYHAGLLQQALLAIPNEDWDQTHILTENDMDAVIEVQG